MASNSIIESTPKSLEIAPYKYEILYDADSSYDYGYLGVCLYRSKRLKIDPRQSDTEVPQTLMHEIIHAIGEAYEIEDLTRHKLDSNGKVIDKIDLMAAGILLFLRNNPDMVKFLIESR